MVWYAPFPCLLSAAQSVCRVVGVRCLKSGRLGAALQWALKAKVSQSRHTSRGCPLALQVMNNMECVFVVEFMSLCLHVHVFVRE